MGPKNKQKAHARTTKARLAKAAQFWATHDGKQPCLTPSTTASETTGLLYPSRLYSTLL